MEPWYCTDSPCPHRIVDYAGGAFGLGAVGGGVYHFVKGLLNSPRLGCYFGAWGATVSVCQCTIAYVRDKEDRWNFIIAAAAASGLLDIRKGFLRASRSAVTVGVLWTLTEGVGIWLNRFINPPKFPVELLRTKERKTSERKTTILGT
ncbi:hypothetical protein MKW98_021514 [Papaver atlanticum]|uniref:Uncharacterized protein n=1 Tax=Papaver atlanticum TaxID=357466 RepID=A0AAD4XJK7_9MAGN|nr:hypothetical protein MKW98_021514 [Papaver atlanticum]